MKHNKKRNTAFIYETLVRELTKAIVDKNAERKAQVTSIIKEFFSAGAILAEQLQLYNVLLETKNVEANIAEKLLNESKAAHQRLDENTIFDAQSRIIAAINKGLGTEVWSNFVPNFKALASVDSIFNTKTSVKKRVLFEEAAVHRMSERTTAEPQNDMQPLDSLTYKSFIGKFNSKYGDLLKEQQDLLNRYITSFADDGLEMRLYLNEELSRLKGALANAAEKETEAVITEKIDGVICYLDSLRKREFVDQDLQKILKAQELTGEFTTDDIN